MKKFFIKAVDRIWPTVLWQGTQIVVYFLDENDDELEVRETRGIDFDELLCHIDRGGSVFITTKPGNHETHIDEATQGSTPLSSRFW